MNQELWKYSVREIITGYKKKLFDCVELTNSIINQIKKLNKKINAFVEFDEEKIIKQAILAKKRWEEGKTLGSLDGIPISIKDLLITKDYPTYRGTFTKSIPYDSNKNAPVVDKLVHSGAIILGKTTTPEFGHKGTTASARYGETLNPWNIKTNSGGSSGGSSAAVSSGMGPLSIGTDGGGSIRIPCSFCGLFGHKPTFGRVPAYPISPFGTVANVGPISRNALDSSILMDVIAKPDNNDWYSLPYEYKSFFPKKYEENVTLKIGFSRLWGMNKYFEDLTLENDVEIVMQKALNSLKNNNKIKLSEDIDIDWPNNPEHIFKTIWHTGAANLARKFSKEDLDIVDQNFLNFIEKGKKNSIFDIMGAEEKRAENGVYIANIFEKYDFIIGPTLPVTALKQGRNVPMGWNAQDFFSWTPFTYPFNLTKNPTSTINCGFSNSNLPVGMQIVAPMYQDHNCLRFANHLEEEFGLTKNWPSLKY